MKPKKSIKNSGLGSGLSSLLGDNTNKRSIFNDDINRNKLKTIPIEFIKPGPWQPRKIFDLSEIESLAKSIKKQGVIQPIIVKQLDQNGKEYLLIAGERRWRACQLAKVHEIPSIVRDDITDEKIAELSLVENIQRSNLNPIEEAEGYQSLIKKYNYTQEQVSIAVGKSRSHIANITRLLTLSDIAKSYLTSNKLTIGQIRPLIGYEDCDKLLEIIFKKNLTSRQVEKLVKSKFTETSRSKFIDVDIMSLQKELSEITGLKVTIDFDNMRNKGNVKFSCKNLTEFNYIIKKIKT